MKANEFVKKFGWEKAREIVEVGLQMRTKYFDTKKLEFFSGTPCRDGIDVYRAFFISDLKHLVESWELVESLGGLDEAEDYYNNGEMCSVARSRLARALVDVESC